MFTNVDSKEVSQEPPSAPVPLENNPTEVPKQAPKIDVHPPISDNVELEDDEKNVGKEDCDALFKECVRIQVENVKYAEKLRRMNKIIRRIQKERRFLMKKLDEFGDDYHKAKLKVVEEEELRISQALQQEDEDLAMKEPKKPKKKIKVKRLQNAPKKPTNAFLMFCQKNRDVVQEQYNKLHKTEISRQEMTRKLAEIWQKTPQEDRKAYYDMYEKDKARYAQEMKDFENKNKASQLEKASPTKQESSSPAPVVTDQN